ncbi:hypothetical protein QR680_000933 [Steinernema hermaphroditum]|uniref:D-2-hydroxyglutarate dehydrogenase, mitochondrial n=1 Tax=Steinernema hermaphroditum TaxID=289476 RepID=A0AA39LEZ2_9BILA|nr:hypothetical protein QR680_000933 [Steinernema hermaphroditum]
MRCVFGILFLAVLIQSKLHGYHRVKRGVDAETIELICARRPDLPYCQASNDRRRFPDVTSIAGKSPIAFGKSTGNDAKFEIPGIGTLGLGQVNTDIAKFIPDGATGTANGGRFDLDGHKLEYMDSESATGSVKGKRGRLHIAGIGTFDVSKQAERGTGLSQIFEQFMPFQSSDDNIGRQFEATPDPLSQQNFPEFRGNSPIGPTASPLVYNLIPSQSTSFPSSQASTSAPKLISTLNEKDSSKKVVLHGAKTLSEEEDFPPKKKNSDEGFIEQESSVPSSARPLPLNPVQVQRSVSLRDLGLSKEEISKICAKFTVQAAKHCYGTQIEKEYIDRCRGYMADCADYISDRKPLGAIANAFSSSVGVTYYNWGVNGIPYYAINEEGGISNGHNGKADFGSWGGGYSENVGVRDFWTQTGEFGGNWYEGTYGHKTGWRVPIAQQFGVEGGQGSQVYIPVKEGDLGKPLGFSRGFFVGPYVGTAEKVGVDWLNGAFTARVRLSLVALMKINNLCSTVSRRFFASSVVPKRAPYAVLSNRDVTFFENTVGKGNVRTEELEDYNIDWMKWYKGQSKCVVSPSSSEEVSAILKHCYDNKLAVVPQSGNTGMVGGSVAVYDEVVLSLKRLNRHYEFNSVTGILQCDAGFILEELDERLRTEGFMMPLDLGAKGSCLVGGNIATCAGGIRLLRYGNLHANVLGLRVVLPDEQGSVVNFGSQLQKDNTGLHMHHMFIGSEGQLGVITRASILCPPAPTSVISAMIGVQSFSGCCAILRDARRFLGEILSSFEVMDAATMYCLEENEQLHNVLSSTPRFNLLIETSGSDKDHDEEKVQRFLEYVMENEMAVDGVLAANKQESAFMWKLRETAPLAITKDGYVYKFDVSLPLEHFYELTEVVRERCGNKVHRVVTYGHMGDGNSHLNITAKQASEEVDKLLYPFIFDWVVAHGGSISAEHGVGQMKRDYVSLGKSKRIGELTRAMKPIFDPRGILSPYKMVV